MMMKSFRVLLCVAVLGFWVSAQNPGTGPSDRIVRGGGRVQVNADGSISVIPATGKTVSSNGLWLNEISTPGTPPANTVELYAKDKAGVATLYFKTDDGTEVEVGSGSSTISSVFGRIGAIVAASGDYSEAQISFTDIATNDFSTAKHGFVPKGTNVGNFLKDDGTWAAASTSFANPTASIGLSAVNGSASSAMRSDAAPAIDQGIAPTWTGQHVFSKNGALSLPTARLTGSWITGGSATTTKPHVLIEPTGATSTAWSTGGTGLGINAASGFAGRLLELQVNGVTKFYFDAVGGGTANLGSIATANSFQSAAAFQITAFGAFVGVNAGSRFVINNGNIQVTAAQLAVLRQTATGVVGTTNFNWNSGNTMEFTFGAGNETITFSNLLSGSTYTIAMIQDTVSGPRVATWPSTVKWVGGLAPTLSNGNAKRDVFTFYSNGTNIHEISRALDVR